MRTLLAALLAAATLALYLYGASGFPLADPDEARYAELAREMIERGDWLTPHLNYTKYFEKPPLVYWATALAFRVLGPSELAARLPSLLGGLVTLLLTAWLARRLYGGATALLATAMLAGGPLFGFIAIVLTLDMSLTACTTAALVAVWLAWSGGGDRRWVRVAYVATALAVLVKGPVGAVLVGGATLPFLLLHGGWRALRPWLDWRGVALAALVALPWFVLVGWVNPEFWHFFLVDQHLHRYTASKEHGEPIWFFVPVVLAALAPWSFALALDPRLLRGALDPRAWAPGTRFLALWAATILVFFSLSISKLATYALPALPPFAILGARALWWGLERGRHTGLARAAWLLLIGGPILGLVAALLPWIDDHYRVPLLVPYLFAGAAPLALTGWATLRLLGGGRPQAALVAFGAGWLLVFAVAVAGRGVANEYRALGLAAVANMRPGDRLVLYQNFVHSVLYASGRRWVMIGTPGELGFGAQQGDQSAWFWAGNADLLREWAGPGRMFVLFNRSQLDRLRPQLDPPPIEVAAKDKKVLVVNRP